MVIPSCSCISTTVWLHHLDSDKTLREKVRWELHKDAACCFEEILEAAPYTIATVQLLTSYLAKYPSKISKIC